MIILHLIASEIVEIMYRYYFESFHKKSDQSFLTEEHNPFDLLLLKY